MAAITSSASVSALSNSSSALQQTQTIVLDFDASLTECIQHASKFAEVARTGSLPCSGHILDNSAPLWLYEGLITGAA